MLGRIALDLTRDANQARRMKSALALAAQHKAELIGVFTSQLAPNYLMYDETVIPQEIQALLQRHIGEEKQAVHDDFMQQAATAGVKAQWRAPHGPAGEALALHARYCDLLIMSQTDTSESVGNIAASLAEDVITSAGRPVLMIPYIGDLSPIGRRVLFCWDYGRRAARALADAAPFLTQAEELHVLTVDPNPRMLASREIETGDLAAYCAAKGYPKPIDVHKQSHNVGIGNTILNTATDQGCDLIVMGAYNRSRVREWILGGTSKTLLQSMTVPILFSH